MRHFWQFWEADVKRNKRLQPASLDMARIELCPSSPGLPLQHRTPQGRPEWPFSFLALYSSVSTLGEKRLALVLASRSQEDWAFAFLALSFHKVNTVLLFTIKCSKQFPSVGTGIPFLILRVII